MTHPDYRITVYQFGQLGQFGQIEQAGRIEREQINMDELAAQTGLHPSLIEQFVEYGLIEPSERIGAQMKFEMDCVVRVRKIERLRHDLGANLPSVAVILDLLDRMSKLEKEVESLRRLVP